MSRRRRTGASNQQQAKQCNQRPTHELRNATYKPFFHKHKIVPPHLDALHNRTAQISTTERSSTNSRQGCHWLLARWVNCRNLPHTYGTILLSSGIILVWTFNARSAW